MDLSQDQAGSAPGGVATSSSGDVYVTYADNRVAEFGDSTLTTETATATATTTTATTTPEFPGAWQTVALLAILVSAGMLHLHRLNMRGRVS